MIDRNVAMAVFSALPIDKLLAALSVVGINGPQMPGQPDPMQALSANNTMQSWNERKVPMGVGADRPALVDKAWAMPTDVQMAQSPRTGKLDDGVDPTNIFLQSGGGV